ncbi:MAG: hypothetical protein DIU56_009915 [Pseudomonadota bacterium]|mgnify:CR=1 FL=1|jgi:hypothetical protein|nr:MAG: hypothetical protein DIU56_01405 [Pseudomonadota bacterium]
MQVQLSRLWREHLKAGCPSELAGVEIAGIDARELDAEINACVCALLTHRLTVDGRIEKRLHEIRSALIDKQSAADPPVAEYCERLNRLLGVVLTQSRTHSS